MQIYYPTALNTVQMYKYTAIVYSLNICTVENLLAAQVGTHIQNCHTLPLSLVFKFIDYSSLRNLLLDVLLSSITLYFYSLFVF